MASYLDKIDSDLYKEGLTYVQYVRKEFQMVRDYLLSELASKTFDIPVKPLISESGYFVMLDISKCRDIIPKKYLESHEFEELKEGELPIDKNEVYINDKVPLDLAFVRWMAVERGVIMMPNSLFYNKNSPYRNDNYVRVAICKGLEHTIKAL